MAENLFYCTIQKDREINEETKSWCSVKRKKTFAFLFNDIIDSAKIIEKNRKY